MTKDRHHPIELAQSAKDQKAVSLAQGTHPLLLPEPLLDLEASKLEKHSVTIAGHRSSISIERGFWLAFKRLAAGYGLPINELVRQLDEARTSSLSSSVRLFVLEALKREVAGPKTAGPETVGLEAAEPEAAESEAAEPEAAEPEAAAQDAPKR